MRVDVGLDVADLPFEEQARIMAEAARLGYGHVWIGSVGDPFQACAVRFAQARGAVPGGIGVAIGITPAGLRTPADLAASAAALSGLTGGRFVLGIGSGRAHEADYRRAWGIQEDSPLALTRAYLATVRGFLAGESVTCRTAGLSYEDARLAGGGAPVPVYVGAAGPQMVRLGGELADGVYLSWCTPANVSWTRARIAEGAARAGRDPADIGLAASVRVCVDDDEDVARRALAAALLPYVLGWGGPPPRTYRAHFRRMGFADEVAEIDRMSERGAGREEICAGFPERMLRGLGYAGPSAGVAPAIRERAAGADVAVVRVVPARPGAGAISAVLGAGR